MSETLVKTSEEREPQSFDDVMLAMDVVDTLRHRERVVDRELRAEAREEALVERLRVIYKNQGIDVPDRILRDGVKALEEKRFVYEPPADGLGVRLAKLYIARDRWLKPLGLVLGLAALIAAGYHFGVDAPRQQRIRAEQILLTQTLPENLEQAREKALALAETEEARAVVETAYRDGTAALADADAAAGERALAALREIGVDLSKALSIRVVSRPGEMSGVFRIPEDTPGVRSYYLIVEAVDARGRPQPLTIASEEDQKTRRVEKWGVRVPEAVFNRVSADKQDDQIIQNAEVGVKAQGRLAPEYAIETNGGAIVEW